MQFKSAYQKLNFAQKQAVDTIEGPVMVVAGPGTGKTQILTLRIANILLQTQVNPENILALTFTESAVQAMRKRLVDMIGTQGYRVEINTFHGFCNEIIKKNPEEFPQFLSFESITEVEQVQIIEDLIKQENLEYLKPFGDPLYYLKAVLSAINDLKKEGIKPEVFALIINKQKEDFEKIDDLYYDKGTYQGKMKGKYQDLLKDIHKGEELATLYQKYQDDLKNRKYYDFNDMLLEVISVLEVNNNLLLRLQEVYQYILVDEHQDTNSAQNKLVELLASFYDNPNLFVVGDEKQSIFRFQGASLENFLYFQKLYPQARLINLDHNYRSTQTILDAAASLIKKNITSEIIAKSADLRANTKFPEEPIKIIATSDYFAEYHFIADSILQKLKAGVSAQDIAILCRNNRDLQPLIEVLEQKKIPFNLEADQNVMTDPQVRKLLMLFNAVAHFGQDQYLVNLLHADFLNIEPLDIYKLISFANANKKSLYDLISKESNLKELNLQDPKKLNTTYKKIKNWQVLMENENIEEVFVRILKDSGLLDYILSKSNSLDILDKVSGLYEEVKRLSSKKPGLKLDEFLSYLQLLLDHDLSIKKPDHSSLIDAVRLMTAHKSKGLEFDYVYITDVFDGHWGNSKKRSSGINIPWTELGLKLKLDFELEQNEDERRLFYVALTRAKKEVIITYSTQSIEGKAQVPAQFIEEIDSQFKYFIDTLEFEKDFLAQRQILFAPRQHVGIDLKNVNQFEHTKKFLQGLFLEKGLSATALNNYLTCPWRYFYRNLIMLPDAKNKNLIFGTAIHKAINAYVRALKVKTPTEQFLLDAYKEALGKETSIEGKEYSELLEKGDKVLKGFYQEEASKWPPVLQTEFNIRGVKFTDNILLTGMIDLLEPISSNFFRVYDFKTGKPKSRNEIEGNTKSGNGDYKRQLVFYKILLDQYQQGRMQMQEGVINFVEPDDKGRFHKELFVIDQNQTKELGEIIRHTADDIVNLRFWNSRCDDKDCEYCSLREVMLS